MDAISELLQQGIEAAKAKKADEAVALLRRVVELDPRNEMAWLWLSEVLDTDEQRILCLENVLAINPDNYHARRGLASLNRRGTTIKPLPEAAEHQAEPVPTARPTRPGDKARLAQELRRIVVGGSALLVTAAFAASWLGVLDWTAGTILMVVFGIPGVWARYALK